jgi:transcriptional regulator with XRE-family HTH domain
MLRRLSDERRGKLAFVTYAARLAQAMAIAKVDRNRLAQGIGVSVQAIGQVLSGETKAFSAMNNAKAARFLAVDAYWLATGEGYPQTPKQTMPFRDLSGIEAQLITLFRRLAPESQHAVVIDVDSIAAEAHPAPADTQTADLPGMSDFSRLEATPPKRRRKDDK